MGTELSKVGAELRRSEQKDWPQGKWIWMMSWCKERGVAPSRTEIWRMAEMAYNKEMNNAE